MCGIFALLNNNTTFTQDVIYDAFMKGKSRGPEHSILEKSDSKAIIGFHRLAINGLNAESNQPITLDTIKLICNGEIYNYKELYNGLNITPTTSSDCEIIIHLYLKKIFFIFNMNYYEIPNNTLKQYDNLTSKLVKIKYLFFI